MNRKHTCIVLMIFCLLFIYACQQKHKEETSTPSYKKIDGIEAKRIMNETSDYILLDVRTEPEFNSSHIEGAILIPDYEIQRVLTEIPNKDALVLIYCRSGRRSAEVAYKMLSMGYTNIYDFGGIIDWKYEIINPQLLEK